MGTLGRVPGASQSPHSSHILVTVKLYTCYSQVIYLLQLSYILATVVKIVSKYCVEALWLQW